MSHVSHRRLVMQDVTSRHTMHRIKTYFVIPNPLLPTPLSPTLMPTSRPLRPRKSPSIQRQPENQIMRRNPVGDVVLDRPIRRKRGSSGVVLRGEQLIIYAMHELVRHEACIFEIAVFRKERNHSERKFFGKRVELTLDWWPAVPSQVPILGQWVCKTGETDCDRRILGYGPA
jgi:hypothetical protein